MDDLHSAIEDGSQSRSSAGPLASSESIALGDTRDASQHAGERPSTAEDAAQVGRFKVLRRLGEGGMGVVYAAYDDHLDRKVALKVLRSRADAADSSRARLFREAQAMARLSHRNIVAVHEAGEHGGEVYVAMEFVRGESLRAWLDADPARSWRAIIDMFLQAGRGLSAAHEAGIVHRDFKPRNVMIGEDGVVKVLDFGLARLRQDEALEVADAQAIDDDAATSSGLLDAPLTRFGAIVGTPAYMAPEQFAGGEIGPASDQFSFCVALYEALYRQPPLPRATMEELLASADRPIAPPPEDRDAPRWIFPVLARGLRRDPRARWPSMAALLEALTQDPAHNPVTGRRARIIMMASLTVYFVATWPLFDGLLNDLGGVQPGDLVVTTALTLAPFIALIWWRWRAISRSVFTLRLALWTLVMMGAMMLSRTIGWLADAPITFTMTCDLTAMTAAAAAGVQAVGRWLWLIAAILGLGAVAAALHPASVAVIFGVAMVVSLSIASVTVARVTARASP